MNLNTINRAFLYGDLLFETIKVQNHQPLLAHAHYDRLIKSATLLKFDHQLSYDLFIEMIYNKCVAENLESARARFVMHRNTDGFYRPNGNDTLSFVEVFPLCLKVQPKTVGLYTDNYKPCNELSTIKSGNALLYVMAAIWAKEQQLDDAIILNEHGCVCEATSSNVFAVKNNEVFTPSINEGCVDGIMRRNILKQLYKQEYIIREGVLTLEQLKEANAAFLTNAIQGVVPIKSFDGMSLGVFDFDVLL